MKASVRSAVVAFVLLSTVLFTLHFRASRSAWDANSSAPPLEDIDVSQSLATGIAASTTITSIDAVEESLSTSNFAPLATSHEDGHHGTAAPGSKVIVMAKLETEDTNWVAEYLPEYAYHAHLPNAGTDRTTNSWDRAIYTVDNPNATLHTPVNKGREAMAYLTYIISHYNDLAETIVFLHSHKDGYPKAWHTDAEDYDNVASLQTLNIGFVQRNGYANLRCIFVPGCPDEIQPFREPWEAHRHAEHLMPDVWRYIFGNDEVPRAIGAACCSQFAVSRKQVHARSVTEYERFRQWLVDTEENDYWSGRVMEHLWHVIFGQDPV